MDATGRRLSKARLPEGVAGIERWHAMIGAGLGEDSRAEAVIVIETDRGTWWQALIAEGYTVYAVDPPQASRYRERSAVSGAKSDAADAHMLADIVRTDFYRLRPVSGGTTDAEAVEAVTRIHKALTCLGAGPHHAAAVACPARLLSRRTGGVGGS
ncbi:transposase [Streptomyces sp. NPDC059118]|uniref:IS110 family transposase n=1 Tax=unclassified Streptomyces TaxID=2593676 RepID=UPI0036CF1C3C